MLNTNNQKEALEIQKNLISNLVEYLNNASTMYYYGNPIINDSEYDEKLKTLENLEKETGYILSSSPTQHAGYIIKDKINIVEHSSPMLSLKKVHNKEEILSFLNNKVGVMSLKLDGLTIRATYENGELVKLETRGNGHEGNDVLFHAKSFINIPMKINTNNRFVVDGECIICTNDFEKINEFSDVKYENPRNLAAGTLSGLDTEVSSKRYLRFVVWNVVEGGIYNSFISNLNLASDFGFTVVPCQMIFVNNNRISNEVYIEELLDKNKKLAENYNYPIDGAVIKYDNINYSNNCRNTEKCYGYAVAYKYEDETVETFLKDIEWTMGTNKLTPVAVFYTVYLSGSNIERASLHNIYCIEDLKLGIGDKITIKKSNMIIPQIAENLTKSNSYVVPKKCPYCGEDTIVKQDGISKELYCTNENCQGKLLSRLTRFVSKQCFNIKGLSEAILKKFIELNFVKEPIDIFNLYMHEDEIKKLDGFGEKSVQKLLQAIEDSRKIKLNNFINALNIPMVGSGISKLIAKYCKEFVDNFFEKLRNNFDWSQLDGIGEEINSSIYNWKKNNFEKSLRLSSYCFLNSSMEIGFKTSKEINTLNGKTFCITGKLNKYNNRDELIKDIEEHGGKYVSSVTKKTDYLINNDTESMSSKNKKAKEVGCKIISEEDYNDMKLPF